MSRVWSRVSSGTARRASRRCAERRLFIDLDDGAVLLSWALAETVHADYRRHGKLTPHQRFAFAAAALGAISVGLLSSPLSAGVLAVGLASLWSPLPLLTLELPWLAGFFVTGRSTQTGSALEFGVQSGRV